MEECNQKLKLSVMDNEVTQREGHTHVHRVNCIKQITNRKK